MENAQSPHALLMVRPAAFGLNNQTAATNAFQGAVATAMDSQQALVEFDTMVNLLREHHIHVLVAEDSPTPQKPDAIFPNNWISFHHDGTVALYPMLAPNRQWERQNGILELVKQHFLVSRVLDYTQHEQQSRFLEGTGSMVIDYVNKIAYASRSARTHEEVLNQVCHDLQLKPLLFNTVDQTGQAIYHTNVVLGIGTDFCTICLDAIPETDQDKLLESFEATNHQVVAISYAQMQAFAGNLIEVRSQTGEPIVLMSQQAFDLLLPGQVNAISKHADLLPLKIPTIERIGGGSVRCMVAGIFNPAAKGA